MPQGTVLGPILFILYMNDIAELSLPGNLILFADDTIVYVAAETWDHCFAKAEECMQILSSWFRVNKLTLNISKTHYLTFSPSRRTAPSEMPSFIYV